MYNSFDPDNHENAYLLSIPSRMDVTTYARYNVTSKIKLIMCVVRRVVILACSGYASSEYPTCLKAVICTQRFQVTVRWDNSTKLPKPHVGY